nr:prefoldin subunit 1 [Ipomoea batatas]
MKKIQAVKGYMRLTIIGEASQEEKDSKLEWRRDGTLNPWTSTASAGIRMIDTHRKVKQKVIKKTLTSCSSSFLFAIIIAVKTDIVGGSVVPGSQDAKIRKREKKRDIDFWRNWRQLSRLITLPTNSYEIVTMASLSLLEAPVEPKQEVVFTFAYSIPQKEYLEKQMAEVENNLRELFTTRFPGLARQITVTCR